jgi:hypothetical protein
MDAQRHSLPELELEYDLFGSAPLQATGTLRRRDFYFRARHDAWTFEVARPDGRLGSDLDEKPVFFREGRHPNASFMTPDEAKRLIEGCAREYWAT